MITPIYVPKRPRSEEKRQLLKKKEKGFKVRTNLRPPGATSKSDRFQRAQLSPACVPETTPRYSLPGDYHPCVRSIRLSERFTTG